MTEISLVDPLPISGSDIHCVANLHVARIARESGLETRLALVEPHYGVHRAERGRPRVDHFEQDGSTAGLAPIYPISASFMLCDITLSPIQHVTDPDRPALRGTESL